jgi:YesN/AraC family two-component response regulator
MASVLIIDDHQGTLETYSTILRLACFEAATATDGRAGIDLGLRRSFDVHLVDLRMPEMSGIDVVRELKLSGVRGRTVIVTAFPEVGSSFDAATVGADGYVEGPLFGDEVVEVVRQAIGGPFPVRHPAHRAELASQAPASLIDPRIREVIRIIDSELDKSPSVTDLAIRVDLSESGLRHLFHASLGITLTSFRTERRLHVAAMRLTTTYDRISQIAQSVGLGNLHAFRKMFHERFGMSPKSYRAQFWRGARSGD